MALAGEVNMGTHTDTEFESELEEVRDRLHTMSDLVENLLADAISSVLQGDETLATAVPLRDLQVNRSRD